MTDDPTRAMNVRSPAYGRVGPADPHADPSTQPTMRPVVADGPTVPTPSEPKARAGWPPEEPAARSRSGVLWTGLILSAVVLLFLLIFILQNGTPVQINFLGASGTLPIGVALLLAAVAGLLLVAIPGGLRILQLRRAARRR
ncbi:lipopolysaccharide assembly protein LapA domain-containing protein [Pseudonocardia adelaidensis]|uniref:Lipopolysaccharide assembly protein LapA domain-containing protein n=1 Tax=Pseudonocardia adelaidensis TaxID=648754 RepID=A0ABP9NR79_9PSEU